MILVWGLSPGLILLIEGGLKEAKRLWLKISGSITYYFKSYTKK
jgi:hypothetical protein